MDKIDLPWVDPDASVGEAVGRIIGMGSGNRAGAVVTERNGSPVVLPLDGLVEAARSDPHSRLDDVEPLGRGIHLPSYMHSRALEADYAEAGPMLDREGADFAAIRLPGAMIHIVTRHETIAASFTSDLKVCRCTGPNGHVIFAGDLDQPGVCNYDDYPVNCRN
jgi:hypothetical protein